MRYLRYAFLATIAAIFVTMALANRDIVVLSLLPADLANVAGFNLSVNLPVFGVFFGGIISGIVIGFVWEWLREYKHRADVTRKTRELKKAEREIRRLKGEKYQGQDDVLALLDDA